MMRFCILFFAIVAQQLQTHLALLQRSSSLTSSGETDSRPGKTNLHQSRSRKAWHSQRQSRAQHRHKKRTQKKRNNKGLTILKKAWAVHENVSCDEPKIYCSDAPITYGECDSDVFVKTPAVEFGINTHGTFGTEDCPAPALGFHPTACGNGVGLGIVSSGHNPTFQAKWNGDMFLAGAPYEGWQMRVEDTDTEADGAPKDSSVHHGGTLFVENGTVVYTMEVDGIRIVHKYKVHPQCTGVSMSTHFTTLDDYEGDPGETLYFSRGMLPDQGYHWENVFGTDQTVVSIHKNFIPSYKYSLVTSQTKAGRTLSLLSCNITAHAGYGGFGFIYDMPFNYHESNELENATMTEVDQDIWTIWKHVVPPIGATLIFTSEYITREMTKDQMDATFCNHDHPGNHPQPSAPSAPSASGDPHLINIRGERFDIYKVGQMEFLRVPYESPKETANFTATATVQDVAGSIDRCKESRYITSMLFGGAWLGDRELKVAVDRGEMSVLLGGVSVKPSMEPLKIGNNIQLLMFDETQLQLNIGEAKIVVSRDIQPVHFFLNVQATALANLGCKVGGLLGEDDNSDFSTPPKECKNLFMLETPNKIRSMASAQASEERSISRSRVRAATRF